MLISIILSILKAPTVRLKGQRVQRVQDKILGRLKLRIKGADPSDVAMNVKIARSNSTTSMSNFPVTPLKILRSSKWDSIQRLGKRWLIVLVL